MDIKHMQKYIIPYMIKVCDLLALPLINQSIDKTTITSGNHVIINEAKTCDPFQRLIITSRIAAATPAKISEGWETLKSELAPSGFSGS